MPLIDKVLGTIGLAMAAFATFFPWYAFLHPEKFSMPLLWQGTTRDLPEGPGREVLSISPLAMKDMDGETAAAVDRLTTATVPGIGNESASAADEKADLEQPFPERSNFRLMHVANGRALIEDASGMYIVRVGSALPDNSRLATFEERNGRWVMITSKGEIYETN
ncbi:flagellar protein [Sinorhizobium numidicum]|uniref:Flagellar protein n=1 Tax=Sinorhizobium numidicum TaxID=680248 RepID=A0ABY8D422_9HYPH|nr:flagellar protein [Sinorhizobium numidicum]WEX79106.1 flagellar protein [Sinorhizobium numidicum]WEX85132.1 flagellar protein [Sinorhizobium numidicum]